MYIHIRGLAGDIQHQSQEETASALGLEEGDIHFTKPINVRSTLEKVGRQIVCRALVSTTVKLECSRCLQPVEVDVSEKFTLLVMFSGTAQATEPEEEVKIVPPDTDKIDVSEEVRQTVLLAIPLKPLCGEECQGLCPHCGMNLNTGRCHCQPKIVDPRWSALQQYLSKKTEGE